MTDARSGTTTLLDVAREAGVSLATASRAINGSERQVGEDLRERVLAAARRLNYSANLQAQAVARGKTNIVGLLVHDIADPYFSSIAAGIMQAADDHDMLVTLAHTERHPQREIEHLAALRGQHGQAAILAGSRIDDDDTLHALSEEAAEFERGGGRVVMISQPLLPVDTVAFENHAGARNLAAELVDLGYRSFGILAGSARLRTARDRVQGFQDGLVTANIEVDTDNVIHGDFTRDGGHAAMSQLLDRDPDVECVFAANDVMAVGAMTACRDRGVDVPRDIAMAGFDDITTLRDVSPALTTVRLPLEKAGRMALELALDAAVGEPPRLRHVPGEVVVRQSTPPLAR
ncbi:LacI family transcriptional regulator [Actinobacteria bacterium YIM 96077]|uniref:LacI family transcriptional regulator n=1 Tax=Phytoactinopolyspora halophila TaxID=1981511 RepID=A0A329QTP2_9ACTN|nr:LacI family DNA-binding transcriptional regulator [Phytoactinopolyspora halophila]AYY15570.1 LacI family transcriptional regulator [Actinobacteria bacterium YIM 96077]RAW15705.1 LacI family transcriptional regulator [Phytoactinopolyspora halophila]